MGWFADPAHCTVSKYPCWQEQTDEERAAAGVEEGQSILSSSSTALHWGFVLLCHSMLDTTTSEGAVVTRMLHRGLGQPRHRGGNRSQKAGTVPAHLTKDCHDHLPSQFSLISGFFESWKV